jgi:hypothetical protein
LNVTIDFFISKILFLNTLLINCDTVQEHRHFSQITSIFFLSLISLAFLFTSDGSIQTAIAIKTTGNGPTPCIPLFCGKPMPQSVIKTFTLVNTLNNKGYLTEYDFSISGNKQYIVWSNHTISIGHDEVYFRKSTNNGANFDTKIKLSNNLATYKLPKVASVGNNVYVAWIDSDLSPNANKVIFRRSIDGGNTFQNPISLSTGVSSLSLTIAALGNNVYLMWEDGGNKVSFRRSVDGGNTFSSPLSLSSFTTLELRKPKLLLDASNVNNVYALWEQKDSSHSYVNIIFAKSTDDGNTFSNPVIVSSGVEDTYAHNMALVGSNIYVVWTASDNINHRETYFRRSTDGGNSFDTPINIDNNDESAEYPSIAVNKDNNLIYVVWSDWSAYNNVRQLFLRKSGDSGASFGNIVVLSYIANSINVPPPNEDANYPKAIAAANKVFVIWSLDKPAYNQDSFILRYSDDNGTTFYNSYMVNTPTTKVAEISSGNVQFSYENNYLHFFWIGSYSYTYNQEDYSFYVEDRLHTRTAGPFS